MKQIIVPLSRSGRHVAFRDSAYPTLACPNKKVTRPSGESDAVEPLTHALRCFASLYPSCCFTQEQRRSYGEHRPVGVRCAHPNLHPVLDIYIPTPSSVKISGVVNAASRVERTRLAATGPCMV